MQQGVKLIVKGFGVVGGVCGLNKGSEVCSWTIWAVNVGQTGKGKGG